MASPLGDKIRTLRTELKMSLDTLAVKTDSSKSYIWELENRDNPKPSAEKINKIAKALKVTPDYLWDAEADLPDASVKDRAFFRKYQELSSTDKKRLQRMLDAWDEDE